MRNRRRRVCALLALAASLGATVYLGGHPHLPPCADEEAHNCVWDASEQGNGRGTDFVDIGGVIYQRVP